MGCNCDVKKRMAQMAKEFQGDPVYLDYNATTPVDTRLLGDLDKILRHNWGNSASLHIMGGDAALWEENTRRIAAETFGKEMDTFQFCSSGCEGISGLLGGMAKQGKHLITTAGEHSVLTQTAKADFPGCHTLLGIDGQGKMDLDTLSKTLAMTGEKGSLFYSPVNHETGAVQPVKEIYSLARKQGVPVILDAVQAAARMAPELWAPFCSGFVISGHKFHVPKGIAMVQLDRDLILPAMRYGGGCRPGLKSVKSVGEQVSLFPGTANTPGIALLGRGIELHLRDWRTSERVLKNLTDEGERILSSGRREVLRESPVDSVPGVLCLSLPWMGDWENFFLQLAKRRICVSRFSACTGDITGQSEVLTAMGVPAKRSGTSLRVSFGRFTRRQDFFALKEAMESYA